MYYLLILLISVIAVAWASRANELFCLSVRGGRVLVVRGRVPGGLLIEIREIAAGTRIQRSTIRAIKSEGGARLAFSGDISDGAQQRIRNTFALYPASRLRAAPPIAEPTVGQRLGIAWLAWWLDRSLYR
jgi:hypothetical protein